MKKMRWLVSDLDGTLFNDEKQISEKNQKALFALYKQGIVLGIASGRPAQAVYETFKIWKLDSVIRFIIGMNGGSFLDVSTQKEEQFYPLPFFRIQKILNHFQDMSLCFQVLEKRIRYTNQSTPSSIAYTQKCGETEQIVDLEAYCQSHEISKLMIYCDPQQMPKVRKRAALFQDEECHFVQTDTCMLEWMDPHIHKGFGLKQASQKLHLDLSECLVIGDANNDIDMFKVSGYSLCVKNGTDEAKKEADRILPYTNQEDVLDKIVHETL